MNFHQNCRQGSSLAIVLIFVLMGAFVSQLAWPFNDYSCSKHTPVSPNYTGTDQVRAFCQDPPPSTFPRKAPSTRFSLGMLRALQMPISLNDLDQQDFESLSGFGPKLAHRIIHYRTTHGGFHSLNDLSKVPGIGPARMIVLQSALINVQQSTCSLETNQVGLDSACRRTFKTVYNTAGP